MLALRRQCNIDQAEWCRVFDAAGRGQAFVSWRRAGSCLPCPTSLPPPPRPRTQLPAARLTLLHGAEGGSLAAHGVPSIRQGLAAGWVGQRRGSLTCPFKPSLPLIRPPCSWVPTPGHTPGHTSYLHRPSGALVAGDAMCGWLAGQCLRLRQWGGEAPGQGRSEGFPPGSRHCSAALQLCGLQLVDCRCFSCRCAPRVLALPSVTFESGIEAALTLPLAGAAGAAARLALAPAQAALRGLLGGGGKLVNATLSGLSGGRLTTGAVSSRAWLLLAQGIPVCALSPASTRPSDRRCSLALL